MTDGYPYVLVDVFTDQAFGGNPLAVFTDGQNVPPNMMQSIAKELNLSETTFILTPEDDQSDFWVRIFTPAKELPMAGHPTIGTAFVLAQKGMFERNNEAQQVIKFQEGVGIIPVELAFDGKQPTMITMDQPLPEFGQIFDNRADFAAMVSVSEDDLHPDYPIQIVSCGVPIVYIPLKDMATVKKAKMRLDLWEKMDGVPSEVFVFALEAENPTSTVHSRMFAPALGIPEDPATGSASGPLGCYLVEHGIVPCDGAVSLINEQGFEIDRPSFLHIHIEHDGQAISRVRVGGQCVMMGKGVFYPQD